MSYRRTTQSFHFESSSLHWFWWNLHYALITSELKGDERFYYFYCSLLSLQLLHFWKNFESFYEMILFIHDFTHWILSWEWIWQTGFLITIISRRALLIWIQYPHDDFGRVTKRKQKWSLILPVKTVIFSSFNKIK